MSGPVKRWDVGYNCMTLTERGKWVAFTDYETVVRDVALRAHSIWVADPDGMTIEEAVEQAMREVDK